MKTKEIYKKLENNSLKRRIVFGKKFILIEKKYFEEFKECLMGPIKIGKKNNYRTKDLWEHIHFVESKNFVSFHYDYGNVYRFLPLGIFHFFIDVIPYFLWHFWKGKKPYSFNDNK